jgi:hypothetical protein
MNTVTQEQSRSTKLEWACRILLTVVLYRIASGYIVFIQTDYQLVSPLIPKSTIYEIARPFMIASLLSCVVFMAALWFYFYKKRISTVVLAAVCIVGYEAFYMLFVS